MFELNQDGQHKPDPETKETYELELDEPTFEARRRIFVNGERTNAYLLIPMAGERPKNVPVSDWEESRKFYESLKF